jgi:hypothetical protein
MTTCVQVHGSRTLSELLLERIRACVRWQAENQVLDRQDANRGRFIRSYDQASQSLIYTGNWQTGAAAMALLSVYARTQDARCLEAAEYAGRYLMSLQILDARQPRFHGAIRELTPQSMEFAPRDAVTAAWAWVWLYNATRDEEYLERAMFFADFHLKYCMIEGWPQYACYMERHLGNFYARGAFQSGTGLFYHDLFMASGDARYIEFGLRPIAENYIKYFIHPDTGRLIMKRDVFTWTIDQADEQRDTNNMHHYNDDFGAAMLQAASDLFQDEKYRQAALKYAHWLVDHQDSDGGFAGGQHPSAVPVSLMYFHDLGMHCQDQRLLKARDLALEKLLAMQYLDTGDPRLDGAFKGNYEGPADHPDGGKICVNNRTTAYALNAMVKLESNVRGIWLGRNNPKFVDPLKLGTHDLKW